MKTLAVTLAAAFITAAAVTIYFSPSAILWRARRNGVEYYGNIVRVKEWR